MSGLPSPAQELLSIRILTRLIGYVAFWGPLAALAILGASYLVACVHTLSSPGTGLIAEIPTRNGHITLSAGSYAIDWVSASVVAREVSLTSDELGPIGKADQVAIRLPDSLGGEKPLVDVRIHGLDATFERDANGRFPVLDLLPKEEKEPSRQPFAVRLEEARLYVVDRATPKPIGTSLRIPWARVDGVGDDWQASGRVIQKDGGALSAEIRSEPDAGLTIRGRLEGLAIARWLPSLPATPEFADYEILRGLQAGTLTLRGPFRVRLPKEGDPEIQAALDGEGTRVKIGGYDGDRVALRGRLDANRFSGWAEAARRGAHARFAGQVDWRDGIAAQGRLEARAASIADVPAELRKSIPPEFRFGGARFDGMLALALKSGLAVQGSLQVETASWGQQSATGLSAMVRADPDRIAVRQAVGRYRDIGFTGAAEIGLKSATLVAAARTETFDLAKFREEIGTDRVDGTAQVSVQGSGSLKKPRLEFRVAGSAIAQIEEGNTFAIGPYSGLASLEGGALELTKLSVVGPAGVATASGRYDLDSQRLYLSGVATGIDLATLHSKLKGTATGRFEVSGTADSFVATGPVEVYGLMVGGESVPLAGAHLQLTRDRLLATDVSASRGAARLHGRAEWAFASGALDGEFSAESVQLHDFLTEGIEGSFVVEEGRIAGTIEEPELSASFKGKDLLYEGIRVESGEGLVALAGSRIALKSARFVAGAGSLEARAAYDLSTREGRIDGVAKDLPVQRLHPLLPLSVVLDGEIGGELSANIVEGRLDRASASGNIEGLELNGSFLGGGFYRIEGQGSKWSGETQIGQPERFLQLESVQYDADQGTLGAKVTSFSLPLENMIRAARPFLSGGPTGTEYAPVLNNQTLNQLERIEGTLDAAVTVDGPLSSPNLRIEALRLGDLLVDGEPAGQIESVGSRTGENWKIDRFQWTGGPGTMDARGTFSENGPISLDGNLYNLDTQWLSRFLPGLSRVSGDASLFFTVGGQTRSPEIEAGLTGSLFESGLTDAQRDRDKELKLEIYPILISEGAISVNGNFNYRGFTGDLKGNVPFSYPFEIPEGKPLDVSLHVPVRSLESMKDMFTALDLNRTKGGISADLSISGPADAVKVAGTLKFEAESLALENTETALKNVQAKATIGDRQIRIEGTASSDRGGDVVLNASTKYQGLDRLLSASVEELLDTRIEGSVRFKGFHVEERRLPVGQDPDDPSRPSYLSFSVGAVDGGVRISGPIREPVISTFVPLAFDRVKGEVPSIVLESGSAAEPKVSPRFNVAYVVGTRQQPAELKSSASVMNLYGGGTLKGRLDQLEANAGLRVHSGFLRLPNARINLQEGGSVRLYYDSAAISSGLRLDVDIEGRTALSAIRFGSLIERYDIFIELRGNLLNQEEFIMTARSDPPDLSQERILNLLGQIDLVEKLSGQLTGSQQRGQLQQALNTLAIPVFFDPVTDALAKQLGLEYLSIEYGPLGQTSAIAAKWLGRGFTIQGRRELSEPLDGLIDYDLRLTYRPPRRVRSLNGLTFSIGIDQERPWKFTIEYGQRFGSSAPAGPPRVVKIGK